MDQESPKPTLPARLDRIPRRESPDGCAPGAKLGIILLICGTALVAAAWTVSGNSNWASWVILIIGTVLAVIGIGFLYAIHRIRKTSNPDIPVLAVELSKNPVKLGDEVEICVRLTGPVELKTLHATLDCLGQATTKRKNRAEEQYPPKSNWGERVLEIPARTIPPREIAELRSTFTVFPHCPPSGNGPIPVSAAERGITNITYFWEITVQGNVADGTWFSYRYSLTAEPADQAASAMS